MSDEQRRAFRRTDFGLRGLKAIPDPWRGKLSSLIGHPVLMLESLIMAQELQLAGQMLEKIPDLQDDELLRHYAM